MSAITVNLNSTMIDAIAHVGRVVTHDNQQYVVHAVEGFDWYAHQSSPGVTTVDCNMTPLDYARQPLAVIIPMGRAHGEGFGVAVSLSTVKRGVCLKKWW